MFSFALLALATVGVVQVSSQPPTPEVSCFQRGPVTVDECCKMPKLFEPAVMEKCLSQIPLPEHMAAPGVPKTEGCCIMQCVLTETGGFANNALNTDAIMRTLAGTIGADTNFAASLNEAVESCARQIQADPAYSVAPISASPDRAGCSFVPQGFINCLHTTLFQSCPASVWTESADCQGLKRKLESGCPFFSQLGRGPKH